MSRAEALSALDAIAHLSARGVAPAGALVSAHELTGGVSSAIFAVHIAPDRDVVVKQALPRLRVADEWLADPGRAVVEAQAIRVARTVAPGSVPAILDIDAERAVIVMAHAPHGWRPWKELLLAGDVDPSTAERAGDFLARFHTSTCAAPELASRFGDLTLFQQLRVDPYYRTIARRHPQLSDAIERYADGLLTDGRCLVHGDFSPKNMLVGDEGIWVLDFEVAHYGDPSFDVAFLLSHLLLKAIHRPAARDALKGAAGRFFSVYEAGGLRCDERHVLGHTGCLVLARVDGKSQVEYLGDRKRDVARRLGSSLLQDPPATPAFAFARLEEVVGF